MWVNNLPKVATQWNSGTTWESNRGPRVRIPTALTTKPLSRMPLSPKRTPAVPHRSVGCLSYLLVELSSVQHEAIVSRSENAALGSDAARCVDVVARHHSYRYARPLALANCVRYLQYDHRTRLQVTHETWLKMFAFYFRCEIVRLWVCWGIIGILTT